MSTLTGLDTSKLNVKQGVAVTPFSTVVVAEPTIPIQETVQVHLGQGTQPYSYYGGSAKLGTISDPTGAGTFDASTNTFTEVVYSTSTATAAQAVLDRLTYTSPTLSDGNDQAVSAAIEVNNSDGSQGNPATYFTIANPYQRTLNNVTPPVISGAVANQPVASGDALKPFSTVNITDQNANSTNYSTAITASILISDSNGATDADGLLTGAGLAKNGVGTYALSATSYYGLQYGLQQLTYTTTAKLVGNVTPSIALTVTDTDDTLTATNATTSVGIVGGVAVGVAPVLPPAPVTPNTIGDPVFRFYNPADEGHFFTSSAAEVQQIKAAGNTGLVLEGPAFHAVDPTTDTNAVSVYRFYNSGNNSHFYTDSIAEVKTIMATNPALSLEGPAFSVDATMQDGDIAVYRFFEPRSDTHLYTTSTAEMTTIAATRPDLILEGPAFYAKA